MTKKKKTVKETPETFSNFNEFAEGWLQSQVDLAEVLAVPGVINLVIEHYHNDILQAYEDYQDEHMTHQEFQRKYYYR